MPRILILALLAAVIIGAPALATAQTATPEATPAATPPTIDKSCGKLQLYWRDLVRAYPDVSDEAWQSVSMILGLPFREYSTIRSEHLAVAAAYLDEHAAELESIEDVPSIAEDLHNAYIGRLVLISRVATAQAEGRTFDAFMLIEQIGTNADTIRDQVDVVASTCGDLWTRFLDREPSGYWFMWDGWDE